ncbi:MAG: TauD/TfdA dioxygenase family protein [Acidimicrobiia bacterium]
MAEESTTTRAAELGLDVRPMSGYTGAEILGVDLTRPLEPAVIDEIRATLVQWKVVFFRDQFLDQAQHVAFGRQFGELIPGHPTLPAMYEEYPEILVLDNVSGATRNQGDDAGQPPRVENNWHTDITFSLAPPAASILRSVVVPPYGGDTQWTNLVRAYSRLSPEVQRFIDGLHAVHHNVLPIERGEMPSSLAATFGATPIKSIHPVVRVIPETGEKVLFVNPNFTSHIVELTRKESGHVLSMLYEELTRAEHTVRFRWEPGSIAFWDNRQTAHLVPTDVPAGMHRWMERITLVGDVPVGPDGQPSREWSA